MKITRWIFLLLVSFGIPCANAQVLRTALGLNQSSLTQDPAGLYSRMLPGYQAGIDVQIGKRRLYFQPGLEYVVSNTSFSHPSYTDLGSKVAVGGVKIPVMVGLRLKPTHQQSFNVRFFTGPSFLAVTSVQHKDMNDKNFILTDKDYHDVQWAWHLGAGLDFGMFFIDLGYQAGLTYVFTAGQIKSEARSNVVYTNVGVKFRLNKK